MRRANHFRRAKFHAAARLDAGVGSLFRVFGPWQPGLSAKPVTRRQRGHFEAGQPCYTSCEGMPAVNGNPRRHPWRQAGRWPTNQVFRR